MGTRHMYAWAGAMMAMAAPMAFAQGQLPRGAQRVDPGVGDVGAVEGVSRADLFKDLRQERGFGTVYRLDTRPPMGLPGSTSTMYMRMDGGVTAVFPESVYYSDPWGVSPAVPPGTTFYIGPLPENFGSLPPPVPRSPNYVDTRVNLQAQPLPPSMALAVEEPGAHQPPSIWADEGYRQRLVGRLMQRAAETPR